MSNVRPDFQMRGTDLLEVLDHMPASSTKPSPEFEKWVSPQDVRRAMLDAGFMYPTPAKVISFLMCKGGVGKTSSAFFTAVRLAMYGARVLVIDGDPQGNLTAAFDMDRYGWPIDEETPVLTDLVSGRCTFDEAVIAVTGNLHLIPSTPLNSVLDGKIRDLVKNPSLPVKRLLDPISTRYEYILIDCAPALNLTNTAIIGASKMVILPVSPDKFAEMGLKQTMHELDQLEEDFNLKLERKIVLTKIDGREFTSKTYQEEIRKLYGPHLFNAYIRTSSDVKNVLTKHEDLFALTRSASKEDYDNLTKEILGGLT